MASRSVAVPAEHITRSILILRGQRVILDSDLAAIYGVSTGRLNEAVKRNAERFPEDFMFRLSTAEQAALISQMRHQSRGGAAAASPRGPSPSTGRSRPPMC